MRTIFQGLRLASAVAAACLLVLPVAAQKRAPAVRILSPAAGTYVSGSVVVRAAPGGQRADEFTDGEDTSSRVTREAVQRRAESSDAVLFMIGQGRAIESPGLKDLCEWLARRSGGRAFFPRDASDPRATFDAIAEKLSSQYLITYAPPSEARDGAWHDIRVEVGDGRYTVRARQGYRRNPVEP